MADEAMREDFEADHVFIELKIALTNSVKLYIITFKTLFIAFFIGQYWYVYCYILYA